MAKDELILSTPVPPGFDWIALRARAEFLRALWARVPRRQAPAAASTAWADFPADPRPKRDPARERHAKNLLANLRREKRERRAELARLAAARKAATTPSMEKE